MLIGGEELIQWISDGKITDGFCYLWGFCGGRLSVGFMDESAAQKFMRDPFPYDAPYGRRLKSCADLFIQIHF